MGKKKSTTGRPKGSRSPDYEGQRSELIEKIQRRLTAHDAVRPSMRAMAAAAGVSVPTLAHYFGSREDVIAAVMHRHLEVGRTHVQHVATPHGPFAESVRELLTYAAGGFRFGRLGEIHSLGLVEGLRHTRLGGEYVEALLEPTINAYAARLTAHVERGEMIDCDVRYAALVLLSPLILLFLHQDELGGKEKHPTDVDEFITHHAEAFVRGYAKGQASAGRSRNG